MNETLPSQQHELQAWRRELPLHREVAGKLNPDVCEKRATFVRLLLDKTLGFK